MLELLLTMISSLMIISKSSKSKLKFPSSSYFIPASAQLTAFCTSCSSIFVVYRLNQLFEMTA